MKLLPKLSDKYQSSSHPSVNILCVHSHSPTQNQRPKWNPIHETYYGKPYLPTHCFLLLA